MGTNKSEAPQRALEVLRDAKGTLLRAHFSEEYVQGTIDALVDWITDNGELIDRVKDFDSSMEVIRSARNNQLRHIDSQPNNDHTLQNREKANLLSWVLQVFGGNAARQKSDPLQTFHQKVNHIVNRRWRGSTCKACEEVRQAIDGLDETSNDQG